MLLWGARVGLGNAYRTLLEMVLGFPQRSPWRWDYAVHHRLCWNYFFSPVSLSLSLESYACKYRDLTFKIRFKKKKKSPVFPFTDVMVLCHPNGKEAAGLAPVVHAHRCWHQLCSALGQQAPGLPVCGMNSKWRTTLSPNCPQAATWIICGTSEFLLHAGKLAPHQVTACVCSPGGCGERRHP